MTKYEKFIENLSINLADHEFKSERIEKLLDFEDVVVWKRKNWNANRAILLIRITGVDDNRIEEFGRFAQDIKLRVGKIIGYIPFFYALGLQIIFYGVNLSDCSKPLKQYTDKFDNQRVVLQSIFLYDEENEKFDSARTGGQFYTGKYQDIIEKTITDIIKERNE